MNRKGIWGSSLIGTGRPEPLGNLGEGMNRMLALAIGLVRSADGILLVDEIENGLHYSVQPDLWRMIFETAQELNVQVFATTHSYDCVQAFERVAQEEAKALVRTRLAWQDEPGRPLGPAITEGYFDLDEALAQRFIDWARRLLPSLDTETEAQRAAAPPPEERGARVKTGHKQNDAPNRGAGREGRGSGHRKRGCGATGTRTRDLMHAMHALYQLSYGPIGK